MSDLLIDQIIGREYFNPIVFAKLLDDDPNGKISILNFFNYIMRKVWLRQTRIALSLYDITGHGFLREQVCHDCITYSSLNHSLNAYLIERIGSRKLHSRTDSNTNSGLFVV